MGEYQCPPPRTDGRPPKVITADELLQLQRLKKMHRAKKQRLERRRQKLLDGRSDQAG